MFWETEIQAQAISTLLDRSGYVEGKYLFENGKANKNFYLLYESRFVLSDRERILVEICHDLWDGTGDATFIELFILSPEMLRHVFSLIQALCTSREAVENWIGSPDCLNQN